MASEKKRTSYEMGHTPLPWHMHDTEADTLVGPDRIAVGMFYAHSRPAAENRANARFVLELVNTRASDPQAAALASALEAIDDLFKSEEPAFVIKKFMGGGITNGEQDRIDAAFGKMFAALAAYRAQERTAGR